MAKNTRFRDKFPHFGMFLLIAVTLAIPLTVWSLNNISTNIQQNASDKNKIEKWAMPVTIVDFTNYFIDTNSWNELFNNIDVFETHIQVSKQNPLNYLQKIRPFFQSHPNVKFALEAGGPMVPGADHPGVDCQNNGLTSARLELSWIKNTYDAGGKVDYIALDDPLRRIAKGGETAGCQLPIDNAINELIIYMKTVHKIYPDIKFGYVPNFPNWQWKGGPSYWGAQDPKTQVGDFDVIFPSMLAKLTAAGEKLYFLHADAPYDYTIGSAPSLSGVDTKKYNWLKRLKQLQDLVENKGLPFGILYNSDIAYRTSNNAANADTQAYITLYRQTGKPMSHFIIETWYTYPNDITNFLNIYKTGLQVNAIPGIIVQQPVYRLFKTPFHLYTTSETEKNTLISSGYSYEGIAFTTFINNIYGVTPLYKIKVNATKSYLYTTSEDEKATVLKTGLYTESGNIGRCYKEPMQPSNSTALYRAYNTATGDFFYTTNHDEFDNAITKYGYVPQKVECFVPIFK